MPKYTVRDISKIAGVSLGTVSRVLNGAGNLDPELLRKTLQAMKSVNYVPLRKGPRPRLKAPLAQGRPLSRTLAVICPGMDKSWGSHMLWTSYLGGIEKACAERNFNFTICMEGEPSSCRLESVAAACDGVLIKTPQELPPFLAKLGPEMPAFAFGGYNPKLQIPQCALDDRGAGILATESLLQLGHRRIAFVNFERMNRMFIARANGYVETMKKAGLFKEELLVEEGPAAPKASPSKPEERPPEMPGVLERLLSLRERPSAIAFANDWQAMGFLHSCAAKGLKAPDTFSVAGIDGMGPLCELSTPSLSSVKMPFQETAYFATASLIETLGEEGAWKRGLASVHSLQGSFIARGSTKKEPAA